MEHCQHEGVAQEYLERSGAYQGIEIGKVKPFEDSDIEIRDIPRGPKQVKAVRTCHADQAQDGCGHRQKGMVMRLWTTERRFMP